MAKANNNFLPLKKTLLILCEGGTEYNYYNMYRQRNRLNINIKPVDVVGGGYSKMLKALKENSGIGQMARVVLLDLDRYHAIPSEQKVFMELLEYVNAQNKKNLPIILVVSNPDFDEFVLLHDVNYSFGKRNVGEYGYKNINELKSDTKIYDKFNNPNSNRSYKNALSRFNKNRPLTNRISYKKLSYTIVNEIVVNNSAMHIKTSNIEDLYVLLEYFLV